MRERSALEVLFYNPLWNQFGKVIVDFPVVVVSSGALGGVSLMERGNHRGPFGVRVL
jgi:hypothetical protein